MSEEQQNDAIIGTAFRWSMIVIGFVAAIAVILFFLFRGGEAREQVIDKDPLAIPDLPAATATLPEVRFTDVTEAWGIGFVHDSGAEGNKLLPETMGSGVAVFDHDGDGDSDLLFVNAAGPSVLYRNDGNGKFVDVTKASGLSGGLYGTGAAVGDIDDDGDADLFLAALGKNRFYVNEAGRFIDRTSTFGLAGEDDAWSTSAGFFDYDNDGDLDLFVCNYVQWSEAIDIELNFTLNGVDRAYGPPTNYQGTYSYLYRNDGGRFTDVSEEAGIRVDNPLTGGPMGKALAVTFADVNDDGRLDILVANDTVQNFLFVNQGNGTFNEIGADAGVGFDGAGNATGAMGIDAAHYRNDDQLGIGIANFANEMTSLYVQREEVLQFSDEAAGEGIGAPSRLFLSFGLFFFDYDLDGRLDLLQTNGHLEDEIAEVQASQSYRQPAQLFWNIGEDARTCYAEADPATTGDLARPIVGRGATFADLDGDGDLDVVFTQTGDRPLVLRNDQQLGHHWLRVKLEGQAIGATVALTTADGTVQRRQVMPTRSYLSQVEPVVTFGLGDQSEIASLTITWPDGSEQPVDPAGIAVDSELVLGR